MIIAAVTSVDKGCYRYIDKKQYENNTGDELVASFRELPTFQGLEENGRLVSLIFSDRSISFPIPGAMKPFHVIPQLGFPTNKVSENQQRLIIVAANSPYLDHVIVTFQHETGLMKPLQVRFPVKITSTSTIPEILLPIGNQTWKSAVQVMANSLTVPANRLILKYVCGDQHDVIFHFKQISAIISKMIQEDKYVQPGLLVYEVADERILIKHDPLSTLSETFDDSERRRDAFLRTLAAPIAKFMTKLGDDLLKQMSKTDFIETIRTVVARLSNEFWFDSNDTLQVIGMKYVLSSVFTTVLMPFASATYGKSFLHVKIWRMWRYESVSLQKPLKEMEEKKWVNECIGLFLLSMDKLIEKAIDIPHDFFKFLRHSNRPRTPKKIMGPVIQASQIEIEGKSEKMWLILTLGFIFILDGKLSRDSYPLFPTDLQFEGPIKVNCTLPNKLWQVVPVPSKEGIVLLADRTKLMKVKFVDPESALDFYIAFCLCRNELDTMNINIDNIRLTLTTLDTTMNACVKVDEHKWTVSIASDKVINTVAFAGNIIKPSLDTSISANLCSHKPLIQVAGCEISQKELIKAIDIMSPWIENSDNSFVTSIAQCMVFDMVYSSDSDIIYKGLMLFRVSDFSHAISLNNPKLLQTQLDIFRDHVADFKVNNIPLLHYASLVSDNPSIIRLICDRCDVNAFDDPAVRRSAAFYALRNQNISILQALIDNNININCCDAQGVSPLTYCLNMNDIARAEFLLDNGAEVNPLLSNTPLHQAIKSGNISTLERLLPFAGCQINTPNSEAMFITHACIAVNLPAAIRLIQYHCREYNPNLYSKVYPHPLHYLIKTANNHGDVTELAAALLSLSKLDVNILSSDGDTPLIAAAKSRNMDIIRMLASDVRCDLNAYDKEGRTALSIAVASNDEELAEILLDKGALANQPNASGEPPIFTAVSNNSMEMTKLLLRFGAKPNQWYFKRKLPVHIAKSGIRELLEHIDRKKWVELP